MRGRLELLWCCMWRSEIADDYVVGNAVEPRPDLPDLGPARQCPPGLQQSLLECILGISPARLQTPAVSQQLLAIPPDDHFKCRRVTITGQSNQPAVRLGLKEPQ